MTQEQTGRHRGPRPAGQKAAIPLLAVLVGLLAVVLVVWLLNDDDDSSPEPVAAEVVSAAGLSDFSSPDDVPVYWAGAQDGATLELSTTDTGTFVRYLTDGAKAGDPRADFLTVGTYEFANPVGAIEKLAKQPNAVLRNLPGGGIAYWNKESPTNIYVAPPGEEVQVEVFAPDPKQGREIVTSGQIVPVN